MVQIFDDLSDCLCQVADLAEFVRITHPEKKFTNAAEDASLSISCLVETMNTNPELYAALKKVVTEGDIVPTDDIDNYVAKLFLFDFEQCGIHLDESKRERVVSLNDSILQIGSSFLNGTLKKRSVLKSLLPESIRDFFVHGGDYVTIKEIHSDSPNELVREAAYKVFLFPNEQQAKLLQDLLAARHELAQLCGFPTYAHRAVNGSLAGSPEAVSDFLEQLSAALAPRAQEDYRAMLELKSDPQCKVLQPWDAPYYASLLRQQRSVCSWPTMGLVLLLLIQSRPSTLAPYLSLGCCMEGLSQLLGRLWGLGLEPASELSPGEVWHSSVTRLDVRDLSSGTTLGYIYCDLMDRPGKPRHDCHFTIRGGRCLSDGSYQLPIVVLSLTLPMSQPGAPSLLMPAMVENLFHEMGHALHSMLARTPYQHVTGTRCSTDLAELPSIFMEYFATDPRVVSTFARHYQTGKPVPAALADQLHKGRRLLAASEAQLQAFYAHLDQALHRGAPSNMQDTVARVWTQYHGLPYVPHTASHLRFGHLVGYGAKYYAYSMSRALAALVWYRYFQKDPFCSKAGDRYRQEVLSHGGGKPPRDLIQDYLEMEVSPLSLSQAVVRDLDDEFELPRH
ncbi:MIPEP [Cordylochernes scorpioides]|uniref:MIPEP n=1 Tax=Cordylochernes scorpioides TaxID=51811 RepID=A0ABY6KS95_9ARAC|nr:MIPEP [Cordylochernes scorpioides]